MDFCGKWLLIDRRGWQYSIFASIQQYFTNALNLIQSLDFKPYMTSLTDIRRAYRCLILFGGRLLLSVCLNLLNLNPLLSL